MNANMLETTASGGIDGAALAAVSAGLLGGFLGAPISAMGGIVSGSTWLTRILKDQDKNK